MNPENFSPEDANLRALLRDARENPGLPPRFQESVWRRIERTNAAPASRWFDTLVARLFRPRLAFAGFAAVMLLSALLGVNAGSAQAGRAQAGRAMQARYVTAVDPYQKTP